MDTSTERAMERVRKLLALAGSANEHEAANAAALAASIMESHRLTQAMIAEPDSETARADMACPLATARRFAPWKYRLLLGIATHCGCVVIRTAIGPGGRSLVAVGRLSDTNTARYLAAYLTRAVDGLAAARAGRGATWLGNYRHGVVERLLARMEEASRDERARFVRDATDAGDAERAIVRVDARRADALRAANERTQGREHTPRLTGARDMDAIREGYRDGATVALGTTGDQLGAPSLQLEDGTEARDGTIEP